MVKKKLLISFSGGETSAFMLWWLLTQWEDRANWDIVVIFANTGQENEATLLFVKQVAEYFGIEVVWVEAVTNPQNGKGVTAKVVDYGTASRNGEPFEAMIAKHGIPNTTRSVCSRELKLYAVKAYARQIGWKKYYTAVGIRNDEIDRVNKNRIKERIMYPLIELVPMTKPMINAFWAKQPFRLRLKGYEGNCKVCWKKSLRKLMTIAVENPTAFDFFERMEKKYENYVPPTQAHNVKVKPPLRFFRGNMSVADIKKAAENHFEKADDDSVNTIEYKQMMLELDVSNGCIESCEVF